MFGSSATRRRTFFIMECKHTARAFSYASPGNCCALKIKRVTSTVLFLAHILMELDGTITRVSNGKNIQVTIAVGIADGGQIIVLKLKVYFLRGKSLRQEHG